MGGRRRSSATIDWSRGRLLVLDQTLLPGRVTRRHCRTVRDVWTAIRTLQVRGAPAIGVAAAFGLVLAARTSRGRTFTALSRDVRRASRYLASSRPTAVNLFWALKRMEARLAAASTGTVAAAKKALLDEAVAVMEEDRETCRRIGLNGARLLRSGWTVLTHCNAGRLATAGSGTALAVIYTAIEKGKRISVYADETRPLLQGARLTTWELMEKGVGVTLITDGAAARVMGEGRIDCCIVGADRIAANGDTANKIGTYSVALAARAHRIPFYVAAPTSTLDPSLRTGKLIPIEERDASEVTSIGARRIAPLNVRVYAPAFDVTPARLISAIITEKGVARAPYRTSLKQSLARAGREAKDTSSQSHIHEFASQTPSSACMVPGKAEPRNPVRSPAALRRAGRRGRS